MLTGLCKCIMTECSLCCHGRGRPRMRSSCSASRLCCSALSCCSSTLADLVSSSACTARARTLASCSWHAHAHEVDRAADTIREISLDTELVKDCYCRQIVWRRQGLLLHAASRGSASNQSMACWCGRDEGWTDQPAPDMQQSFIVINWKVLSSVCHCMCIERAGRQDMCSPRSNHLASCVRLRRDTSALLHA